MTNFKRLIAQVHDIQAESPAQADEVARIRADAVNAGMRILGHGTAWAATVLDSDSEDGGLTDILRDAYLLDEIDDDPERNPHTGYIALDETIVFEKLLAWRDAAVKTALEAQATSGSADRSYGSGNPYPGAREDGYRALRQVARERASSVYDQVRDNVFDQVRADEAADARQRAAGAAWNEEPR